MSGSFNQKYIMPKDDLKVEMLLCLLINVLLLFLLLWSFQPPLLTCVNQHHHVLGAQAKKWRIPAEAQ